MRWNLFIIKDKANYILLHDAIPLCIRYKWTLMTYHDDDDR